MEVVEEQEKIKDVVDVHQQERPAKAGINDRSTNQVH